MLIWASLISMWEIAMTCQRYRVRLGLVTTWGRHASLGLSGKRTDTETAMPSHLRSSLPACYHKAKHLCRLGPLLNRLAIPSAVLLRVNHIAWPLGTNDLDERCWRAERIVQCIIVTKYVIRAVAACRPDNVDAGAWGSCDTKFPELHDLRGIIAATAYELAASRVIADLTLEQVIKLTSISSPLQWLPCISSLAKCICFAVL